MYSGSWVAVYLQVSRRVSLCLHVACKYLPIGSSLTGSTINQQQIHRFMLPNFPAARGLMAVIY